MWQKTQLDAKIEGVYTVFIWKSLAVTATYFKRLQYIMTKDKIKDNTSC